MFSREVNTCKEEFLFTERGVVTLLSDNMQIIIFEHPHKQKKL